MVNSGTPVAVALDFGIPAGNTGATGTAGTNGTNGTNGTDGATWYTGAGAPSGGLGVNNDLYLNTTNDDVYRKTGGTWAVICNIRGATGATGATGSTGAPGIGVATTGPLYGRLRKQISGTITTSANTSWADADAFNPKDYGAVGDGTTNDTTAWQACLTAAAASSRAVVMVPNGLYKITTGLTLGGAYGGRISIVGIGTMGVQMVCGTNGINVFDFTLGAGDSAAEFRNLTFGVASGITGLAGINVTNSGGSNPQIFCESIYFEFGYVNGITCFQVSSSYFNNCYGRGGSTTYDTGSGAGSGSFIKTTGFCLNNRMSNIAMQYFYRGLEIGDGTNAVQGYEITNVNTVFTPVGIDLIGDTVVGTGAFQLSNIQVDDGNAGSQSISIGIRGNHVGDITLNNFLAIVNAAGSKIGIQLSNAGQCVLSGMRIEAGSATDAIDLNSMVDVVVTDLIQSGFTNSVNLDASCSHCKIRGVFYFSTNDSLVADSGTNNSSECQGSTTWDPALLVPGAQGFVNLTVTGVKVGATVTLATPYDLQNMIAIVTVFSANTVRITLFNSNTATTVNLGSGTWTVRAINPGP